MPYITNIFTSTIDLPLPSSRLAHAALRSLSVDAELSPLVLRSFSTISPKTPFYPSTTTPTSTTINNDDEDKTILRTEYKATTNRMLRVAVNGFMESLSVVLGVMAELDVDVLGVEFVDESVGDGGVEVGKKWRDCLRIWYMNGGTVDELGKMKGFWTDCGGW
jgi:EKC/KEOPS complex subunit PCC1/LAGE3